MRLVVRRLSSKEVMPEEYHRTPTDFCRDSFQETVRKRIQEIREYREKETQGWHFHHDLL